MIVGLNLWVSSRRCVPRCVAHVFDDFPLRFFYYYLGLLGLELGGDGQVAFLRTMCLKWQNHCLLFFVAVFLSYINDFFCLKLFVSGTWITKKAKEKFSGISKDISVWTLCIVLWFFFFSFVPFALPFPCYRCDIVPVSYLVLELILVIMCMPICWYSANHGLVVRN
jgi:nitrate/nitrite transporter NarK